LGRRYTDDPYGRLFQQSVSPPEKHFLATTK
jgi:hypothetical protein